ncbi:MAG TPA: hypothetical protein PLD62_03980 [Candidatus Cloacimonadota bacterium]|nr:hypothetical protein [Candidatus Cloacimonadota bacterium]
MKENPQDKKIQQNLQPGELSAEGFLGEDKRSFFAIIEEDESTLEKLELTKEQVADRLQYFTDLAFESFDGALIIDEKYEVRYFSVRGKLICPFGHPGVFRKGQITLQNLQNSHRIVWTPLNIHLIREHGFFEGKNSKHRLEPVFLKETIF